MRDFIDKQSRRLKKKAAAAKNQLHQQLVINAELQTINQRIYKEAKAAAEVQRRETRKETNRANKAETKVAELQQALGAMSSERDALSAQLAALAAQHDALSAQLAALQPERVAASVAAAEAAHQQALAQAQAAGEQALARAMEGHAAQVREAARKADKAEEVRRLSWLLCLYCMWLLLLLCVMHHNPASCKSVRSLTHPSPHLPLPPAGPAQANRRPDQDSGCGQQGGRGRVQRRHHLQAGPRPGQEAGGQGGGRQAACRG